MTARTRLPITQRHRPGCRRRDCDCPWSFRVRLRDGSQPRVTRDTWAEAEQAYHELMARRPEPLADQSTTIAQWAERWQVARAPVWREATRRTRACQVPKNVLPYFGGWKVTQVRYDDVLAWVTWLTARGTGQTAIFHAVSDLRAMYQFWLESGRLLPYGNPAHPGMVRRPEVERFPQLTAAQVEAIIAAARPDLRLVIRWQSVYAMRASETLGLRAEDITFTGKDPGGPVGPQLARLAALPAGEYDRRHPRLHVRRQLDRYTRERAATKNRNAVRSLKLPQRLAGELAAGLAAWPEVDGWLFTNGLGSFGHRIARPKPWQYVNYWAWFHRAADAAGVVLPPRHATHMMKHYRVAALRDAGWREDEIADWTGNAAQTLARVYGKRPRTSMDDLADEIDSERDAGPGLRAVE